MTMVGLFQNAMELASQPLVDTDSEDVGYLVGGQAEQAYFARPFENLMDRQVPFEDEAPAVFDLIDRVVSAQVDGLAILLGKLGPEVNSSSSDASRGWKRSACRQPLAAPSDLRSRETHCRLCETPLPGGEVRSP